MPPLVVVVVVPVSVEAEVLEPVKMVPVIADVLAGVTFDVC